MIISFGEMGPEEVTMVASTAKNALDAAKTGTLPLSR
jgi:hypothetical protein